MPESASTVSDSVSNVSDSASVLARSDDKMGSWRLRVLPPIITRRASRDSVINQLLDFSLPKSLCDIDPVEYETESTLHFFLTSVQASKTSVVIANDDPFKMNLRLPGLANLFDTYEQFAKTNASEANQLHSFVPLLTMAFRRGKQPEYYPCRIEHESEICLTAAGPGFPMRAQLDFAFIYDNPSLWHPSLWPRMTKNTLDDPKGLLLATLWQANTDVVPCISLLLFPGEGKRDHHSSSKNQLICDLSTCLHQQESLGLTVVENFGFVASNGVVQIYGMRKTDEGMAIYEFLEYPSATFNLRQPLEFLRFFSFLCKLAESRLLGHPHLGGFPKVNGPKNHVYSEGKSGS